MKIRPEIEIFDDVEFCESLSKWSEYNRCEYLDNEEQDCQLYRASLKSDGEFGTIRKCNQCKVDYLEAKSKGWIEYNKPFWCSDGDSFKGEGLNNPGALIETSKGIYLIGHINEICGVCDDCTQFEPDTIVIRYKIVWKE